MAKKGLDSWQQSAGGTGGTSGAKASFDKNVASPDPSIGTGYANQLNTPGIAISASLDIARKIESPDYLDQFYADQERFFPNVDFTSPENFARFGSAEQYYIKAAENIYRFYPYDGSAKEKLEWQNQSSYFDHYIYEYEYPRTNGYVEVGETWGSIETTKTVNDDIYKISDAPQYISVKGGPHAASVPAFATSSYSKTLTFKEKEQKANVFDRESRQIQNFTINPAKGNTVEFWLKLPDNPNTSQTSPSHAYFDLWNGQTLNSADYGRFLIETRYDTSQTLGEYINDTMFAVTYQSGSISTAMGGSGGGGGVLRAAIGAKDLSSSLGIDLSEWNHYAFSVQNDTSNLKIKFYVNGILAEETLTGSILNEVVTGSFNATIGAYKTAPDANAKTAGATTEGYGALTGSYIDEFRFWKNIRNSSEIKFNWFKQVNGGSNTDYGTQSSKFSGSSNPVDLGVYFKFNEGITLTASHDSVVLDYSGRVSNGAILNYTSAMRSTGSAIVEKGAAAREFKDPIIYDFHPDVHNYINNASYKGREYDFRNSMNLYHMLPAWIMEGDEEKGRNNILKLTQVMASYFDNTLIQIKSLNDIKDTQYVSGSASGSINKPIPFAERLLKNSGFVAPNLFSEANVFEELANRNDEYEFKKSLEDVKNQIYSNVYNNLVSINKAKGTEKSIKNLLNCLGVDDSVYALNFYANNSIIDFKSNILPKTIRKSYVDFNENSRFGATVYQMTNSAGTTTAEIGVAYITGSTASTNPFTRELGFTVESEVIFPEKPNILDTKSDSKHYGQPSSSLFGMHQPIVGYNQTNGDTTWAEEDYANFQVYAVREDDPSAKQGSNEIHFVLTCSNVSDSISGVFPKLVTPSFRDVYKSEKWNFAVRVAPSKYPNIGIVSGSAKELAASDYKVEFIGYNMVGDTSQNSFHVSGTISNTDGPEVAMGNKRLYVGAHRTNFTGSLLSGSDVKISSCRFWQIPLEDAEIVFHATDPRNYGLLNPEQNYWLLHDSASFGDSVWTGGTNLRPFDTEIPKIKTLVLNWDFDTVTGSDSGDLSGQFTVSDFSSGSHAGEYGTSWSTKLWDQSHPGRGAFFPDSNNYTGSISREYVYGYRQQVPENMNSYQMVQVLDRDDELFTRRTRPITFNFAVEKSLNHAISEEMLNFIAGARDASGLETVIGDPVNRYRGRYKSLEKLRRIFFEKIGNVPDLDKYLEYYKWLDEAVSEMIEHIVPASSGFTRVSNVIESHVFERPGKYRSKFPMVNKKFNNDMANNPIESSLHGINQLRYDWKRGHAPVDGDENKNLLWWKQRAKRINPSLLSGDANLDASKEMIHSASLQTFDRGLSGSATFSAFRSGGGGIETQQRSKPKKDLNYRQFVFAESKEGSSTGTSFNTSTLVSASNATALDEIDPNRKYKPEFKTFLPSMGNDLMFDGRKNSPIVFYSSSSPTADHPGYQITSQHLQDYYVETKDIPLQGPFTERNVGGYAYRHSGLHLDIGQSSRFKPEAWYAFRTVVGPYVNYNFLNPFDLTNGQHAPRARFMREEGAKRPVNIKNIKTTTTRFIPAQTSLPPFDELGNMKNYIGNYEKDYQIVQIGGRDINNRYLTRSGSISTASIESTGTPSVSGAYDREIPNRGKSEHIIVSRFSAPGGPEVNGQAFLNYESETFSPYNAMTFRNLSVRQPLRELLTRHNAYGGYDSVDGSPMPSYYKIQRNARKYIQHSDIFGTVTTASVYDNYFVQHQIPQSDSQYAWITASIVQGPLGYSEKDFANKSYASTDVLFATASDFGAFINTSLLANGKYIIGRPFYSAGPYFLAQDFVGLNKFSYMDSDEMDSNTISYIASEDLIGGSTTGLPAAATVESLNGNLLRGNGPYGHPSWKQIQNSYHPIARYLRKKNTLSILTESISASPGEAKLQKTVTRGFVNFTEPAVTFKFKPFEHTLKLVSGEKALVKNTYGNNLVYFTNRKINKLLNFYEKNPKIDKTNIIYNDLKKIYVDKDVSKEFSTIDNLDKLNYKEIIYPRETNTGLGKIRGRENYTVSSGSADFNARLGSSVAFWKDNINDRLRADNEARNAEGMIIASGSSIFGISDLSIWPLDAEEPFYDLYIFSASVTDDPGSATRGDFLYWAPLAPSGGTLNSTVVPRFADVAKNGELSYAGWLYNLLGVNIQGKVRYSNSTAADVPEVTGSGPLPNFLTGGTEGLRYKPTASMQYEYPNMMMSGAAAAHPEISRTFMPSASLHLIPPYRTDVLSNNRPWFNSYEEYSEDIRRIAKDYTVLPEFRISDHIKYYLDNGFFADNNKFLDIIGASLNNTSSAATETGEFQPDFFKIYSHTDFMKHFTVLQSDHKKNDTAYASKIRLEANAIKKLLPYQGFYPALRSVELAYLFSSSYGPHLTGSNLRDGDQERMAALYQPFFAPGLFFNTIKSGIAVDYPVHTASAPQARQVGNGLDPFTQPTQASTFVSNQYSSTPNYKFPFDAILDPDQYLPVSSSLTSSTQTFLSSSVYFVYPNFTGSTNATYGDHFYAKQTDDGAYSTLAGNPARQQPQIYFQWKGQSDVKYSLAANNFFAESVNFFLENGTLTSFISKAEKDFKSMVSGSTYFMDVLLYKTDNFVSYEGPGSGSFEWYGGKAWKDSVTVENWNDYVGQFSAGDGLLNLGVSARGMHYGPSYETSPWPWGSTGTGSVPYAAYRAQDPSYAPHTPPYFYGTSRARIAFKPHSVRDMAQGEASKFTLEEILSNARIETIYENENELARTLREDQYRNNHAAGIAQMQLSASVNLFGQITLKEVQYGTEKNPDGTYKPTTATTPVVQGTNDAWVIETKFECPSINLANMDTASLGARSGDGKEKYYTRGIWKGYGQTPSGSEGLFLQLKESYPQITNDIVGSSAVPLTGSLIEVCGFKASSERVGKIRGKKTIHEAIIAVPIDQKGNFYGIDEDMFLKQKSNYQTSGKALLSGDFGVQSDVGETSITKMIEKMKKYSLPPQMDFLNNPNIDPFVMYIFEFKHSLDRKDLADIWQNLMPKISTTAEKAKSVIEHPIGLKYEFFGEYSKGELPSDIRWMVFKVKQKAKNNFFNVTQQSEVSKGFAFTAIQELQGISSSPEAELVYSYNWPYDFFSLVELAQIESNIVFEPPNKDE